MEGVDKSFSKRDIPSLLVRRRGFFSLSFSWPSARSSFSSFFSSCVVNKQPPCAIIASALTDSNRSQFQNKFLSFFIPIVYKYRLIAKHFNCRRPFFEGGPVISFRWLRFSGRELVTKNRNKIKRDFFFFTFFPTFKSQFFFCVLTTTTPGKRVKPGNNYAHTQREREIIRS